VDVDGLDGNDRMEADFAVTYAEDREEHARDFMHMQQIVIRQLHRTMQQQELH
jgi:hypothetical protein